METTTEADDIASADVSSSSDDDDDAIPELTLEEEAYEGYMAGLCYEFGVPYGLYQGRQDGDDSDDF